MYWSVSCPLPARAILVCLAAGVAFAVRSAETPIAPAATPPAWAYPLNPPDTSTPSERDKPVRIMGSRRTFLESQLKNLFNAADWHPDDHPAMPRVVASGRPPVLYACGFCHLPAGGGRPENSSLAGLPASYIEQQLAEFGSGGRRSAVARLPAQLMRAVAQAATSEEIHAAADYFAHLKPQTHNRVLETSIVPPTHVSGWILVPNAGGEREPIGSRIIETPENLQQFEHRDEHTRVIAYVPPGSRRRGQLLVTTGAGRTVPCATCHGSDLHGTGEVPSIAGRSPSYLVRQLFDIQYRSRSGPTVALMSAVVQQLSTDDMVSIAAYLADLN